MIGSIEKASTIKKDQLKAIGLIELRTAEFRTALLTYAIIREISEESTYVIESSRSTKVVSSGVASDPKAQDCSYSYLLEKSTFQFLSNLFMSLLSNLFMSHIFHRDSDLSTN